jgi:aldose sugar dehydrogenase
MKKAFIYTGLAGIIFIYGFSVSHFHIFPYKQLQFINQELNVFYGKYINPMEEFETTQQQIASREVEILETFLKRLLIKKVPVPDYTGHGGGISEAGDWLFLITNKGSVRTYNLKSISVPDFNLPEVPMDLEALNESGHLYKNQFRHRWFRVNGVFAEQDNLSNKITLYASHNGYNSEEDCITHNISRLQIDSVSDSLHVQGSWSTIFTAEPCLDPEPVNIQAAAPYPGHISGGDIASYSDELLLVTVGDYNRHGIDGMKQYAMDSNNPYGKHILINKETGEWTIYSIGNRNPSGLHIGKDGVIWSVENGPEAGDELNIIEEGKNYGWPHVSYGYWYNPEFNLPGDLVYGSHDHYDQPAFAWVPSIAPSSIVKIEGDKFAHWRGDLIVGTMRNQSLHRLRLNKNNEVIYDEPIHLGHRIRDMIVLKDEKIVLITDDGFLIFIEDGGPSFRNMPDRTEQIISDLNRFDRFIADSESAYQELAVRDAKTIYEQNCASCHNLNAASGIGPHLNNLFNRTVGGADDYNYSYTLRQDNRNWTPELLESFLENPDDEFRGNRMQQVSLTTAETDSIIQYLKSGTQDK